MYKPYRDYRKNKKVTSLEDLKRSANEQWERLKTLPFDRQLICNAMERLNQVDQQICDCRRYELLG